MPHTFTLESCNTISSSLDWVLDFSAFIISTFFNMFLHSSVRITNTCSAPYASEFCISLNLQKATQSCLTIKPKLETLKALTFLLHIAYLWGDQFLVGGDLVALVVFLCHQGHLEEASVSHWHPAEINKKQEKDAFAITPYKQTSSWDCKAMTTMALFSTSAWSSCTSVSNAVFSLLSSTKLCEVLHKGGGMFHTFYHSRLWTQLHFQTVNYLFLGF